MFLFFYYNEKNPYRDFTTLKYYRNNVFVMFSFIYPVPAQKGQIHASKNKGKFIQTIFSPQKLHNL